MADNVAITAGSGTTVAAAEATYSGDVSKIQLVQPVGITGTEGSRSVIEPVFTTTGEQRVYTHRDLLRIECSVSAVTTSVTAYTAGDQVGALINFAAAARASGGGGLVVGALLVDDSDVIGAYDLVMFSDTPSLTADNAVFGLNDVDANKITGLIQLSGAYDIGSQRLNQAYNLAMPYVCTGTALYGGLITRYGHTFFSAGVSLRVILFVERN